jgi:hypothetical protein
MLWGHKGTPNGASSTGRALTISTWLSIKSQNLPKTKSLEFRFETFNTFNHPQFYPNARWTETSTVRHSDTC